MPLWDRWLAHPTLDAYWRAHAVTTNIAKVRAPVLQISGWYDDSRGPIDYTNALLAVPGHPFIRLVMGPGAHKGVDYVGRRLRAAVARRDAASSAPLVRPLPARQGQRRRQGAAVRRSSSSATTRGARKPRGRSRARCPTKWYVSSAGAANTSAGNGMLDTIPPTGAPADTFTYDPANPTPYLIDSRELETSLNEDYHVAQRVAARRAGVHVEAAHEADRGDGADVGDALGRDRRQGHRLERDAARRLSRRPRRARAGRLDARAIPARDSTRRCRSRREASSATTSTSGSRRACSSPDTSFA